MPRRKWQNKEDDSGNPGRIAMEDDAAMAFYAGFKTL